MQAFLIIIHTIVSVLLVAVILMQASQGGGLSGTFGSTTTSALLGGRGAGTFLSKLTTYLAVIFLGLAVVISLISAPSAIESESILKQEAESQSITPGADLSLPTSLPIDNDSAE
ncbi:MAG: preprotein translocase subunit SecG [Candidatus Marinimicrobia bacterium]|nr:preprotein translocase subunit SecG [Candidatus Neomarinimicrobiota bacterium]